MRKVGKHLSQIVRHYITQFNLHLNLNLNLGTLGVYELNERHKSEYISSCFKQILSDWEINKSNVLAIVTDNGKLIISLY